MGGVLGVLREWGCMVCACKFQLLGGGVGGLARYRGHKKWE